MKKLALIVWFSVACLILTLAISPPMVVAEEKASLPEIKIRVNGLFPPTSIHHKFVTEAYARWIKEAVPRAKITVYPGNTLIPYFKAYDGVQKGIADFTWTPNATAPGAHPLHEVVELPFLFPSQSESNVLLNELYRNYPIFLKEFSPKVKLIASNVTLPINIHSNVPIRKLEDFKGLMIGCLTANGVEAMKIFGASPTQMPPNECYTPLERGMFKAVSTAWGPFTSWRLYEVTKYHTLINVTRTTMLYFFNRKTWDKFTPEEQEKLTWIFSRMQYYQQIAGNHTMVNTVDNKILKSGKKHEMIKFSPEDMEKMKDAVRPMWNKWAEKMEAKGYPGKEILKFIERNAKSLSEG